MSTSAFKEWAIVCEALGSGLQSVIVRKGGIAEGPDGFSYMNRDFVLFPTWFHEQLESTRLSPETPLPPESDEEIEIRYAASVEWSGLVENLSAVEAIQELHVLNPSVVGKRFSYDGRQGIHVAFVRVFRLDPPKKLKKEARFGGCRSWVELPDIEGSAFVSVLSDEEHEHRRDCLFHALGLPVPR